MTNALTRLMVGGVFLSLASTMAVGQPTSTSQSTVPGAPTSRTQTLSGTVVQVDGNTVAVRMSSGEIRMFTPPPERRFVIDGKELSASELAVGTRLKATVTETSTPVTDRTVQALEGKVWYAAGPTVILTLPNGQNRQYTVPANSPVKFTDADGKSITVFDLRKDMMVKAVRITESPRIELATNVAVTGTGPSASARAAASGDAPAVSGTRPAAAGGGAPAASGARPAAAPAASSAASTSPSTGASGGAAAPRQLPKTASQLPLLGLTGLASLLIAMSLSVRRRRASR
jgi:LPXTG-motif cell wall-anchored protein